jgi:hypothetical protein
MTERKIEIQDSRKSQIGYRQSVMTIRKSPGANCQSQVQNSRELQIGYRQPANTIRQSPMANRKPKT